MKKILITTTALASLVAGAALAADAPKVTVGSTLKFKAASVKQKKPYSEMYLATSPAQKKNIFDTTAHVFARMEHKADNGVIYGANVSVSPFAADSTYGTNPSTRTYGWVESRFGVVQFGQNAGALNMMKIDAATVAVGTGGASGGDWSEFVYFPGYDANTKTYIDSGNNWQKTGDLILEQSRYSHENRNKITIMTPRYSGLQFGVSYTLDPSHVKKLPLSQVIAQRVKNVVQFAANYAKSYDKMNIALSAGVELGKAHENPNWPNHENSTTSNPMYKFKHGTNKLKAYEVGAAVGFGDFTVAASYGDNGKSLQEKGIKYKNDFYTAALGYQNGPYGASLSYFNGRKGGEAYSDAEKTIKTDLGYNKTSTYSIGLDYKVAAGFKPFFEVNFYDLKINKHTKELIKKNKSKDFARNKGTVVLIGTKMSF